MSLQRIYDQRVFDDATTDERRAHVYVRSGELGLQEDSRADVILMDALVTRQSPQRVHAYETIGLGQNAARVRHDLEDVLARVSTAGYRPVLILDDTEKFVSPGRDGKLDEASIENLYHHGVRLLGELHVDLVVAMHPRFEEVDRVKEVIDRLAMPRIEVPELPADVEDPALAVILGRRMERDGFADGLETIIERAAIDDLQVLYHERDHDLRSVLKLAHAAGAHALGRNATVITARDVRGALSRPAR